MTWVVAITGTIGSGKTSLVSHLLTVVPGSVAVYEDDYQIMTDQSLDQLQQWWKSGGQVDRWDCTAMIQAIAEHCRDRNTTSGLRCPMSVEKFNQQPLLVFLESQFGKYHSQLRNWIDQQFWIEVPMDMALARKVQQQAHAFRRLVSQGEADGLQWIEQFVASYLNVTRPIFLHQRRVIPEWSEFVINGELPVWELAKVVLRNLPEDLSTSY